MLHHLDMVIAGAQFSSAAVRGQHERVEVLIKNRLGPKFAVCDELLDTNSRLFGIYLNCEIVGAQLGIGPSHNVVLVNGLSNSLYVGIGASRLLREGYFGSARVLLRQLFEILLTTKLSLIDLEVHDRWAGRSEVDGRRGQVQISREILNKYWPETAVGRRPLPKLWRELNNYTHHTRFAQQPLLIPPINGALGLDDPLTVEEKQSFAFVLAHTEHSLDLLFSLLDMASHLLFPHFSGRVRGFMDGYAETDIKTAENALRSQAKSLSTQYWKVSQTPKEVVELWRPSIRAFKAEWLE